MLEKIANFVHNATWFLVCAILVLLVGGGELMMYANQFMEFEAPWYIYFLAFYLIVCLIFKVADR